MISRRIAAWIVLFSLAFAFVESSIVVYLRDLYYPDGFSFPLKQIRAGHILVELFREFSTMVMLISLAWMAGKTRWQRMAWFMIAFGVWDIFYYVWLKVILNWPASLFDWDVLFLIPVPWIGPVIAPVLISVLLIVAGALILRREATGREFHAPRGSWGLAITGTVCILYTFMRDTDATLKFAVPQPYWYWLFLSGLLCYIGAMFAAFSRQNQNPPAGTGMRM